MTINSTVRSAGPFVGTGLSAPLPFSFKVFQAADVKVVKQLVGGSQVALVLSVDYAVTLSTDQNQNPGGSVALTVPLGVGETASITSAIDATQPASLTNLGGFYPRVIEDELDRLTILIQQQGGAGGQQSLRVQEVAGVPALPSATNRANKLLSFDSLGNPSVVAPANGSAAALAATLADSAAISNGAGAIGYGPTLNTYPGNTVGGYLDGLRQPAGGNQIAVRKNFVGAVTRTLGGASSDWINARDAGVVGDGVANDTSAWLALLAAAEAGGFTIRVPARFQMRITSPLSIFPGMRICGEGGAVQDQPRFIAVGGTTIFQTRAGFGSESSCFENIGFDSATVGTGIAIGGATNSYVSQSSFVRCHFRSNLQYGIAAPIILCDFVKTDFGSYPGPVQSFQAIRAIGTLGSFEPNANAFHQCTFRKSNAPIMVEVATGGAQWNFYACDFEQNANTTCIVRADGAGSINFYGGYVEANTTPYFLRVLGNAVSFFCNNAQLRGMHFNNPAQIAVVKRDFTLPNLEMTGCYGSLQCKVIENEAGLFNQPNDIEMFYGNHFVVSGAGSIGQLNTVSAPGGYSTRYLRAVTSRADVGTFNQLNSGQFNALTASPGMVVCNLGSPNGAGVWAGQLHVMAVSGVSSVTAGLVNTASYVLNISVGGNINIASISATGVIAGAAANQPSFTFSLNGGGTQLLATPIGSTAGTFSFLVSAVGAIKVS